MSALERRNRLICLLWRRGVACDDIGAIVGIDGSHVSRLARAAGERSRGNPFTILFWMQRDKSSEVFNEGARLTKLLSRAHKAAALVAEGRTRDEVCRLLHVRRADLELLAVYAGFEVPGGDCDGVDETGQVKSRSCVACSSRFEAQRFRFRCDRCLQNAEGETEYLGKLPA